MTVPFEQLIAALQSGACEDATYTVEDGTLRFTDWGRMRYGARFEAAGIDIAEVKTVEAFEAALENSWAFEATALADWLAERPTGDPLERALLVATVQGEREKAAALMALLKSRRGSLPP